MQVRTVHPDRTLIELNPEEREELLRAIERMGQTFVGLKPTIVHLGEALKQATEGLRAMKSALPKEVCQRLDPAFSEPEESFPIRRIEPVNGRSEEVR